MLLTFRNAFALVCRCLRNEFCFLKNEPPCSPSHHVAGYFILARKAEVQVPARVKTGAMTMTSFCP